MNRRVDGPRPGQSMSFASKKIANQGRYEAIYIIINNRQASANRSKRIGSFTKSFIVK